jgi:hypothetical protein
VKSAGAGGAKMNDDGLKNLMVAVVRQAVRDYHSALYRYNTQYKLDKKEEARRTIRECEIFFRKNISAYAEIDGEKIIEKVRDDVCKELKKNRRSVIMEVPKFDN